MVSQAKGRVQAATSLLLDLAVFDVWSTPLLGINERDAVPVAFSGMRVCCLRRLELLEAERCVDVSILDVWDDSFWLQRDDDVGKVNAGIFVTHKRGCKIAGRLLQGTRCISAGGGVKLAPRRPCVSATRRSEASAAHDLAAQRRAETSEPICSAAPEDGANLARRRWSASSARRQLIHDGTVIVFFGSGTEDGGEVGVDRPNSHTCRFFCEVIKPPLRAGTLLDWAAWHRHVVVKPV